MTNPNDEAFPRPIDVSDSPNRDGEHRINCEGGLTKREYFAAKVLCGVCSSPDTPQPQNKERDAEWSVEMADALIGALNRSKPPETQ